jgi:polar amino acid transport system substrate-binding protein
MLLQLNPLLEAVDAARRWGFIPSSVASRQAPPPLLLPMDELRYTARQIVAPGLWRLNMGFLTSCRLTVSLMILAGLLLSLVAPRVSVAAPPPAQPGKLRVLVKPAEPFSFEKDGQLTGFSVELWKQVAQDAGLDFTLTTAHTMPEMLAALQNGQADAGVGAVSITPEREKVLDFGYGYFESGLQILTTGRDSGSSLSIFAALLRGDVVLVVSLLLAALFVFSNVLWWCERKVNEDVFPKPYIKGVWEAMWWAASTIISGGCENKCAVSVPGRLVAIVWMLGGIGLTSFITATLASAMTVHTLTSQIQSVDDLKGLPVGTIAGSSAETFLKTRGFNPLGYAALPNATEALTKGEVKAIVYDSPMLRYYQATHAESPLQLAGGVFDSQSYGFALPLGSPHRKAINEALLNLQRKGVCEALEEKWFAGGKKK